MLLMNLDQQYGLCNG